jgi:hypothetical protein
MTKRKRTFCENNIHFGKLRLELIALMMEAAGIPETSINFTRPHGATFLKSHLHTCGCENLRSHHFVKTSVFNKM